MPTPRGTGGVGQFLTPVLSSVLLGGGGGGNLEPDTDEEAGLDAGGGGGGGGVVVVVVLVVVVVVVVVVGFRIQVALSGPKLKSSAQVQKKLPAVLMQS
jgi:predicted metalloprotease